jgi:hypothetical protein
MLVQLDYWAKLSEASKTFTQFDWPLSQDSRSLLIYRQ